MTVLDDLEKEFSDTFQRALATQHSIILTRLESDIGRVLIGFGERADVSSLISIGEMNILMQDVAHIVQKAFDAGVAAVIIDGVGISVYSGAASALIADVLFSVHQYNRTTLRYIGEIFASVAYVDYEDWNERQEEVVSKVNELFSSGRDRSGLATAAGVYGAYNSGVLAAGQEQALVTNKKFRKKWNTKNDGNARLTHILLDNTVVDLDQPFLSGGWPLHFPGDPKGEPSEVINCRCTLRIVR